MNIQTFSIVVGTRSCNAHCKFCVSHMTGFEQLNSKKGFDVQSLNKAVQLAQIGRCTTLLFTGKGEPLLYPQQITDYLKIVGSSFPLIEIQTNAILVPDLHYSYLQDWSAMGLDTIAISTVGIDPEKNKETYLWHKKDKEYPDLEKTIKHLKTFGYSIRLCVMMRKNAVDSFGKVVEVINWCKANKVDQITFRPIVSTQKITHEDEATKYIYENGLEEKNIRLIYDLFSSDPRSTKIMSLVHGATVYDFDGQNVCMSNCLTNEPELREIRTLIYYPTGEISYDWQYPGAKLKGPVN